jgi:hypothetical protein
MPKWPEKKKKKKKKKEKRKKKLKTNMCGSGRKMGLEALKAQSSPKRGYAGKYKKLSLKTQNIQVLD